MKMTENTQNFPEQTDTSNSKTNSFKVPTKCVKNMQDISLWENSEAYQEYLGFIFAIGDAIKGKKIRDVKVSEISEDSLVKGMLKVLEILDSWIDEIPLAEQQQRFGNKAFRDWHLRLEQNCKHLLIDALSKSITDKAKVESIIDEIQVYMIESFGNPTRIDYGTGHEMNFVMFLSTLFMVGALNKDEDRSLVGLVVFDAYMKLVRRLQTTYRMEPAGSQGVWSLDDYQFVAFIWGAAQMVGHTRVKPKSISDYDIADMLAPDYHFFSCIKYIASVKTGPFAEHSNQLWNVSGVPLWDKVYSGLVKMYRAEVLSKFPVIQHTYFGSLFKLQPATKTAATNRLESIPTERNRMPPRPDLPQNMANISVFPLSARQAK